MSVCLSRYVTVLVELTRIEGTKHGRLIASQMLDVAMSVCLSVCLSVSLCLSLCLSMSVCMYVSLYVCLYV